jgi:polar amino acid transport system substrate-binding protein
MPRPTTQGGARRRNLGAAGVAAVVSAGLLVAGMSAGASAPPDSSPSATDSAGGSMPAAAFDQTLFDLLPASIQDSETLRFGALWETPPVIGVDPADTSTPVGLAPDLADAMEPILGVTVEWQNMQWPAQLPGVQSGVVDALFGQVSVTAERELSIVDLVPYDLVGQGILVPAGNPEGLTRLGDACGLTIGVPVASIESELVTRVSAEACESNGEDAIEIAEYQGAQAAVSALRAGTIEGWVDSMPSLDAVVVAAPDSFAAVAVPEDEDTPMFGGIAVAKDQPGVSEAIAGALGMLIANGTYDALLDQWGMSSAAITADQLVINPVTGTAVGAVAAPTATT